MTWLVTGGAGYIGAHVATAMAAAGEPVVVLDDLSTGTAGRTGAVPFVHGSVGDQPLVEAVMREHGVRGVVHLAAKKQVGESVERPLFYWDENVGGLTALLAACAATGVESFVFSSSSATYGMPDVELVTEDTPLAPLSPYGQTKVVGEWMVSAVGAASGMRWASLRYFNVAGAASPQLGDPGVFNLIPLVFQALTRGQRPQVFGADYPTPDGTCIRDYVHVVDLADAHLVAARELTAGRSGLTWNVGRGEGSSVLEVMAAVAEVTGLRVDPVVVARRRGDPARIVASAARIRTDVGWAAERDLHDMVASAWTAWVAERGRPGGAA